jgi:D-beta-D-heptose 7-phosphate kinase/D-beta-D-heptose 1-phosphate adenosyltransferase
MNCLKCGKETSVGKIISTHKYCFDCRQIIKRERSKKTYMKKKKVIAVSGGFDPVHIGHIRMFKESKKYAKKLVVILNSDDFLKRKKGFVFMPFHERKEVLESIKYVDKVVAAIDKDQTVCKTLEWLKPDIFANGGDRTSDNIPEFETCKKYKIEMMFNVGGGKVESSSKLIEKVLNERK